MKKSRFVKFLVLTLALVMLLNVTASAVSYYSWSCNGVSCHGECAATNASTVANSPMYIQVLVVCTYKDANDFTKTTRNQADNAGTRITAYVTLPSGSTQIYTEGVHWTGSCGPYYTDYGYYL